MGNAVIVGSAVVLSTYGWVDTHGGELLLYRQCLVSTKIYSTDPY